MKPSESIILEELREPNDYFKGHGHLEELPTPKNILLFVRRERVHLQQEALQNRSHHRWVLILNLQTKGHVNVDHRTHLLQPGQALLVSPFQFHHFTQLESGSLFWVFCTFELAPTPLLDALRHRVISLNEKALDARNRLALAWKQVEVDVEPQVVHGPILQSETLSLLLELRRQVGTKAPAIPEVPGNRLLENVTRLLDVQGQHHESISDLAARLNISESGLRARFRDIAGVPLGQYLRNYRINRAMALLRTTKIPVAEVAAESGFGSPQAFSRAFRNATGDTPLAYREQ